VRPLIYSLAVFSLLKSDHTLNKERQKESYIYIKNNVSPVKVHCRWYNWSN